MPQSLAKVLARTVYSTKHRQLRLHDPIRRSKLYAYNATFGTENGDIGAFVRAAPLGNAVKYFAAVIWSMWKELGWT